MINIQIMYIMKGPGFTVQDSKRSEKKITIDGVRAEV
jgi:predicted nucleic acid-binding Zn ribbon protein